MPLFKTARPVLLTLYESEDTNLPATLLDKLRAPHTSPETENPPETSEKIKLLFLCTFAGALFVLAFFFSSPLEIWKGSLIILVSPANLITDYFALAGVGATLCNASVMAFFSIFMVARSRVKITGVTIAAVLTLAGFSLFGKNLYNSLPIILGVALYSRLGHLPMSANLMPALFGTALAPLVSEITFNLSLPLALGAPLGIAAGLLVGVILPPLAHHFMSFHWGFNLYNIGFTTGIIGTFFIAILRTFGVEVAALNRVSSGYNLPLSIFLFSAFALMLIAGVCLNGWHLRGYRQLLRQTGKLTADFLATSGFGLTLVNMAVMGMLSTGYVLAVGGELTGPSIGGVFTVVGFAACGKHPRNVLPVLAGIFLTGLLCPQPINSAQALLAALFGTTLAPVSGFYGPFAGFLAGALHMAMVTNIGYLHAGMNLYNNGFSGGFVAAALCPILDYVRALKEHRQISRRPNKSP